MPTQVVAPITVDTFKPYAKLGKSNAKIQGRICELLFRLIQTNDLAKVRSPCKKEIAWLEAENYKPATCASYVAAYRKSLSAWFGEHPASDSLMSQSATVKGTVL